MISILVFGFGSIGRRHVKNLKNLTSPRFTVIEPDRGRWVRDNQIEFRPKLNALKSGFDLGVVCSPTYLHLKHAQKALTCCKALFVEKPLAYERKSLKAFIQKVKNKSIPVMVGCNYRFEKGLRLVKALLKQKRLGKIRHVSSEFGYYLPFWVKHLKSTSY